MNFIVVTAVALVLLVLTGAVLGWISFIRLRDIERTLEAVKKQVTELQQLQSDNAGTVNSHSHHSGIKKEDPQGSSPLPQEQGGHHGEEWISIEFKHAEQEIGILDSSDLENADADLAVKPVQEKTSRWLRNISNNWMIWLGGSCVGLAGIFLVKYSMDTGLLGPKQRVVLAVVAGAGLHGLAEWLRRRTGEPHPAFAALAGGASIMLYSAMLAALHLYHLLGPVVVFSNLALISVLTMGLALRYGPILAVIGILGAYIVPVLVSLGSTNILGELLYSLIITGAALLLLKYVYRAWLWYGMLTGGIGWWLLSCIYSQADGYRGFYLAALAYGVLAIPAFDWSLNKKTEPAISGTKERPLQPEMIMPIQVALVCILLCQAVSIGLESFSSVALLTWSPLIIILLLASRRHSSLSLLPWLSLAVQSAAWLYCGMDFSESQVQLRGLGQQAQKDFLLFSLGMTGLYSGIIWWVSRPLPYKHIRASLMCLAPVLWLAMAYLLVTDLSVNWQWSLGCSVLGIAYLATAGFRMRKDNNDGRAIWLVLAGHFALALSMAMYLRQASLTLALATQLISLAWVIKRFKVPPLAWLVKAILTLVVIRLTINPFLLHYPSDIHWTLWTYGGTFFCCAFAALLTRPENVLRKWLEAGSLHLLVLFTAAEVRYWLYDGRIFFSEYTLTEAAINTTFWGALGLVYAYRGRVSSHLKGWYVFCSHVLLALSLCNYLVVLTILNPLWSDETVAATPVWNILLLAYGVPVIVAGTVYLFYEGRVRQIAAHTAGAGLLIFISVEIRHLWNGVLDITLPFLDAELYTYSIVWLVLAITTILFAAGRGNHGFYKAGMALLLVVIAKIFIIDMADLEGLLRVASFMGLGLSLLGLAYLYQKIAQKETR